MPHFYIAIYQKTIDVSIIRIYLLRLALTARFRTSWVGALMHPIGHGLSLTIGLNSWRLSAQKGVTWKGRVYRMGERKQEVPG